MNIFYGAALLAMLWHLTDHFLGKPLTSRIADPGRTLPTVLDRSMEAWENQDEPSFVALLGATIVPPDDSNSPDFCIEAYRAGLKAWPENSAWGWHVRPGLLVHFSILLAEQGRWSEAHHLLSELSTTPHGPAVIPLIKGAYTTSASIPPHYRDLVTGSLQSGWAQDRLMARLARLSGDPAEAAAREEAIRFRGTRTQERIEAFASGCALVWMAGLWLLYREKWSRVWERCRLGDDSFVPWSFQDGLCVALRAATWGTMILIGLPTLALWLSWSHVYNLYLFWMSLPMLWMLHRHCQSAADWGWWQAFGLGIGRLRAGLLLRTTLWAFAIAALGSAWLVWAVTGGHAQSSVFEWLVEPLLYETPIGKLETVVNMSVCAPWYEEILFRGLIYGTLRKRWSFLPAAMVSSIAWSATHFYSLSGTVAVVFMGMVLCLAFERSRSLIPCMACHSLLNLTIACQTLLIFE